MTILRIKGCYLAGPAVKITTKENAQKRYKRNRLSLFRLHNGENIIKSSFPQLSVNKISPSFFLNDIFF